MQLIRHSKRVVIQGRQRLISPFCHDHCHSLCLLRYSHSLRTTSPLVFLTSHLLVAVNYPPYTSRDKDPIRGSRAIYLLQPTQASGTVLHCTVLQAAPATPQPPSLLHQPSCCFHSGCVSYRSALHSLASPEPAVQQLCHLRLSVLRSVRLQPRTATAPFFTATRIVTTTTPASMAADFRISFACWAAVLLCLQCAQAFYIPGKTWAT